MEKENLNQQAGISFFEASSIIVGHGVGSGILSVPYIASKNSLREIIFVILFCFGFNIILHLIIAELSLNNNGAQFINCLNNELLRGKLKTALTWLAFGALGLSVIVNVSAFLTGASAVFSSWFGCPRLLGILIFYALGAGVVFFGIRLVGFCEKLAVSSMIIVVFVLFGAVILRDMLPIGMAWQGFGNALALFSMVSFSLSAVMSTPQIVKGLRGDAKKIRGAIILGLGINTFLIFLITLTTLLGAGKSITENGALVDLAGVLGGWVSVVGYIFTLLALATSFWANTLNLRDIVSEQLSIGERSSWLLASLPCLVIAFLGLNSFVGFTRLASVIQLVTGTGIIVAYNFSRKRVGKARLVGKFGGVIFQVAVVLCTLLASLGAIIPID